MILIFVQAYVLSRRELYDIEYYIFASIIGLQMSFYVVILTFYIRKQFLTTNTQNKRIFFIHIAVTFISNFIIFAMITNCKGFDKTSIFIYAVSIFGISAFAFASSIIYAALIVPLIYIISICKYGDNRLLGNIGFIDHIESEDSMYGDI